MKALVISIVIVGTLLVSEQTSACSYSWSSSSGRYLKDGRPVPDPSSLIRSSYVFAGTVESVTPVPVPQDDSGPIPSDRFAAVIRVEHVWRGHQRSGTISVYTAFPGPGCGFFFQVGRCYLVFADLESDGVLRTSMISYTTPWERADELLFYVYAFLGEPTSAPR